MGRLVPVSGPVEREFKLRLAGEPAFAALRARLLELGGVAAAPVRQVNHFFDTASGDLRRGRVALRLREESGAFVLTLKGPELGAPGVLSSRSEEELPVESAEAREVLEGRRDPLVLLAASPLGRAPLVRRARELAADAPLSRLGGFENERERFESVSLDDAGSGRELVFELDRTRFPGGITEHELEVEVPEGVAVDTVESGLRALLARLHLRFEAAPSKAARLFRILDHAPGRD